MDTAEQIRTEAFGFPHHTSGRDGLHPRAIGLLSNGALEGLAEIFRGVEVLGDFPPAVRQVLVRLIPKPLSDDTRPIGLFRGIYRVWARLRARVVREWALSRPEDSLVINMLAGRQTLDGVWRAQVRAKTARDLGFHSAEVLWDVKKAYENIQHADLVTQGDLQGYPQWILRVSLASYRWSRRLLLENQVISEDIWPGQGIVAGSSFATFEVAMLVQHELGIIAAQEPKCQLSMHVDDLSFGLTRPTVDELTHDLIQIASKAKYTMEEVLHLPLAAAKSQVIASSKTAEQAILAAFGNQLGELVPSARRLGVDHALKPIKNRPVYIVRKNKFDKRKSLLHKLKGSGLPGKPKVLQAGMLTSLFFGAEIHTPPAAHISEARKLVVAAHSLKQAGVPHQLSLLGIPPQADPKEKVLEQALLRWHREVWYSVSTDNSHQDKLSLWELQQALQQGMSEAPELEWDLPGPVHAAIRAVRAVGWTWVHAGLVKTHNGENLDLQAGSPAMLKQSYRTRWAECQTMEALGHRILDNLEEAEDLAEYVRKGIDLTPLRQVLRSKAKNKTLKAGEKRQLLSYVAHTGNKIIKGSCTKCGTADSVDHRLYHCQDPKVAATRDEWGEGHSPALRQFNEWHKSKDRTKLETRLWMPHPKGFEGPKREVPVIFWDKGNKNVEHFEFDPNLPIYSDGSCMQPTELSLARAGASLVQINEKGEILRSVQVAIPRWCPQTAAFAEHLAANLAYRFTKGKFTLVTDCMSVVASALAGLAGACTGNKPMAGLWLDMREGDMTVVKVKAHRTREQAVMDGDPQHFDGNDAADRMAKEAAKFYPAPKGTLEAQMALRLGWRKHYLWVGKTLGCWTKQPGAPHNKTPHKTKGKMKTANQHVLLWDSTFHVWNCRVCLCTFRKKPREAGQFCKAFPAAQVSLAKTATEQGHKLWVCNYRDNTGNLMYCGSCGCYAQLKGKGLREQCLGNKGGQRGRLEKFILNGKHPTSKKELTKPRKIPPAMVTSEACEAQPLEQVLLEPSAQRGTCIAAVPPAKGHKPPPWHLQDEWNEEELQGGQEMDEPWEFDEGHSPFLGP
jgi:hypothetical protein